MFRKLILCCLAACVTLSAVIDTAEAARVGSRRSIGIQRQVAPPQRQAVPPTAAPQQQAAQNPAARPPTTAPQSAQPSGWRRWAAPLAGLAAGIGLAALLSHFGMGGEFAGLLLGILAIVLVIALLRRLFAGKQPNRPEPAYADGHPGASSPTEPQAFEGAPSGGQATSARNIPAGFDITSFERQAKVNFVRLQAANDAGNLVDIREFTSPEMFAEIKLDIDARGGKPQKTDVVMLNAEVLEVAEDNGRYVASVYFSGTLREEDGGTPEPFSEVWHLTKPTDGNRGWVLAGIQQIN